MAVKIEVSDYGRRINRRINRERQRRDLSIRSFARQIGRSESYARARLAEENEWAPADLERMGNLWGIPLAWFTTPDDPQDADDETKRLSDEEIARIIVSKLANGDLSLVANRDPHKREEMEGGDGR